MKNLCAKDVLKSFACLHPQGNKIKPQISSISKNPKLLYMNPRLI